MADVAKIVKRHLNESDEPKKITKEMIDRALRHVNGEYTELFESLRSDNELSLKAAYNYLVAIDKFLRIANAQVKMHNNDLAVEFSTEVEELRKKINEINSKYANN